MGRYLLCGREAGHPFEIDELDIRIYTIEELCYYVYNYLPLIDEHFISEKLISFLKKELNLTDIADKIEKFYESVADQDTTLMMLLSEVGYYSDIELQDFQARLVKKRRKTSHERTRDKADMLYDLKRYYRAMLCYKSLLKGHRDTRLTQNFYGKIMENIADSYGHLSEFERTIKYLVFAYEETKEERIIKKILNVSLFSGEEAPSNILNRVPEDKKAKWLTEFKNREMIIKENLNENETLHLFLKDNEDNRNEIRHFISDKKEEFRRMLEI